jgi:hypothetical protein
MTLLIPDTHERIMQRANRNTVITYGYLDMDKKEIVSKETLRKRFPNPHDYVLRSDCFDEENNEHQVLFAMSKKYFTYKDSTELCRKLSFN